MPLHRSRFAALLALFAMVLQGFLPLVAHARSADAGPYGIVCTVDGPQSLDVPGGKLPAGGDAGKHQKHCTLCVMGAERASALVAAPLPVFIVSALAADVPAAQPAAQLHGTTSSPAQPRAPPVQS